jgi:hypothetical protein
MITDADVKKLEKKFATKDDLKRFATKDDLKGFATKDDLKKYATKDDILDFKDAILYEIKGLREEVAIVTGYKDQIEDIDYRVERLEKHTKIPPVPS